MLKYRLFLALSVFLLSACASAGEMASGILATDVPPTPTVEPLSDIFKSAINDFITAGSKLNAATGQGVSYLNYRDYYAEVNGAYELALVSWPENFAPEAKELFTQAVLGWDLTGFMWSAKLNDEAPPTAPDEQRYAEFEEYAGDYLQGFEGTLSTRYFLTDENIGILLSLASEQFEAGRESILPLLQ